MKAFKHSIVPVAALILVSSFAKGQLYKVELDEKVDKSSLIVEGRVIGKKSFWNEAGTMIYTANTVEIYKSFKGEVKERKVEILTQGGTVGLDCIVASDLLTLDIGQTGIFFCQENLLKSKSPFTKKILLDAYSSDQGFLRYDEANDEANAPFVSYKGIIKNLYGLIQQKTGKTFKVINTTYKVGSTNVSNGESGTLAASISSFSPTTVNAGTLNDPTNNVLTINGSGFGATPSGSCAVRFKDGNSASSTPTYSVSYKSSYMVSWSDTKIVVKVPARAATGKISVVISNGTSSVSSVDLNVFYSVLNAEFDFSSAGIDTIVAAEPRLMNDNNSGGYSFYYSTSTAGEGKNFNTSPEKATFLRALNSWKEQVGLNFIEGGTTTSQVITNASGTTDNRNVIMFDNTNTGNQPLSSGVLATTYSRFSLCYIESPFSTFAAQKTEFDMVVRNPGVSQGTTAFTVGPCFPSTGYDLEMVMFHELGHALNLAHINDDLESSNGNNALYINPSKLMHYAITNYVNRRSLDVSAYEGGLYATKKQNNSYGVCGLTSSEMTLLSYTVISNDNCPATFPTTTTPVGTVVNFDLVHATSNKLTDPQFTAINCGVINGQFVVNNAFYAIKTNGTSNGSLNISISGYATTPAGQADTCSGQGVRLAVYDVSSCPTGQNYPQPIACRTFTGNGALSAITGLAANHNYLLYFDGLRNTKANFSATLNGSALPLTLSKFYGEYVNNTNKLYIDILQAVNIKTIRIEKSADGINFTSIGNLPFTAADLVGRHTYIDAMPFAGNNYYRLAIVNNDGSVEYSNIINLKNEAARMVHIYPNPVKDVLNINITSSVAAKYNYSVYDMSGKLLLNKYFETAQGLQTIRIPVQNIAAGTYLVKIADAAGNTVAKQSIIKQ